MILSSVSRLAVLSASFLERVKAAIDVPLAENTINAPKQLLPPWVLPNFRKKLSEIRDS